MAEMGYEERLKTGRNDECPCGSKKKYKKCHLAEDEKAKSAALAKVNAEAAAKAAKDQEEHEKEHGPNPPHGHPGHVHGHTEKTGGKSHGPASVMRQVSAPRKVGSGG